MDSAQDRRLEEVSAEQLLGALAGVVSAHVVTDAGGELVEIHVLATPELHPKQVVRNVESALSAGLGIKVDRRIVSVAQIRSDVGAEGEDGPGSSARTVSLALMGDPEPEDDPPAEEPASRLEYVRFESRRDKERCTCRVTLRAEEGEIQGSGSGPDTAAGRAEAAVRAVFEAIGHARPELRLELEGVAFSASRGRQFLIVSAHAILERETIPLAGAATLSRSPEEAAILAALQASNRWSG